MSYSWGLLTLPFSFGISGYRLSPFLVRLPLHLLITIIGWIYAALDSLLYQDIAFFWRIPVDVPLLYGKAVLS